MFLRARNDSIDKVKFCTDGCLFTIAACSAAAAMAEGNSFRNCYGVTQGAILDELKKMPKDHEHCALLAATTFQKALMSCKGVSRSQTKRTLVKNEEKPTTVA